MVVVRAAGIECGVVSKIQEDTKDCDERGGCGPLRSQSKSMKDFDPNDFDIVISMCGCGVKLDGDDVKVWKQQDIFEDWNLTILPSSIRVI